MTTVESPRTVQVERNYETYAWLFMRYSAVLLIPLVWIHVLINDVLVGVHAIDLDYVAMRWAFLGWRIYDISLLAFAFAHGVNGLRTVSRDYIHNQQWRKALDWGLLLMWLVISAIGAAAIVGGVRLPQ
jgi:succinate dehydrogenase / fumarate reductase membrane anchor subunit